jgi:hypothetical protein
MLKTTSRWPKTTESWNRNGFVGRAPTRNHGLESRKCTAIETPTTPGPRAELEQGCSFEVAPRLAQRPRHATRVYVVEHDLGARTLRGVQLCHRVADGPPRPI